MKMYLSSFGVGNQADKLTKMIPLNNRVGYISNALDFTGSTYANKSARIQPEMRELDELGFDCVELDLRDYFGKPDELREFVKTLGSVWVSGGNVFVLRQAFKLSGFDTILLELSKEPDFLYGGYSAGVCVLSPTLDGYHLVDDATDIPFDGLSETIWNGVDIIDYTFLPHFNSMHPESGDIDRALDYCLKKSLPYKTARDGDVIIVH